METVIRDVIHGDIVITDPLITRLIDTMNIVQLGQLKQQGVKKPSFKTIN